MSATWVGRESYKKTFSLKLTLTFLSSPFLQIYSNLKQKEDDNGKYLQILGGGDLFFLPTKQASKSTCPLTSQRDYKLLPPEPRFNRSARTINPRPLSHWGRWSDSAPSRFQAVMRGGNRVSRVLSIADIFWISAMPDWDWTPVCWAASYLCVFVTFPPGSEQARRSTNLNSSASIK